MTHQPNWVKWAFLATWCWAWGLLCAVLVAVIIWLASLEVRR